MIAHCLAYRVTDGSKVVSPTHRPRFTPYKHYFSASDTHLCYSLSKSQGLVRSEGLGKFKILPHRVSNPRPPGLQYCVLTTTVLRAPVKLNMTSKFPITAKFIIID
jgi:hypothetical protein